LSNQCSQQNLTESIEPEAITVFFFFFAKSYVFASTIKS